ncbi:hypothetical protein D9Q98_010393 [Chlorella vulgaris]|uniref:Starch synthase catalytic domain-containing protein n=1 Tax=Chlorella vulgaris TaxID=3077 RepID=A0A9D4TS77_CHLVU|nr:hypothetical protein D9Q98_010393 [Chlorella vulgaris]
MSALCSVSHKLKVVFVAAECSPWSKVGGLADVLAALPPALAARGHEVMTIVPQYAPYDGLEATGISVPLDLPAADECSQAAGSSIQAAVAAAADVAGPAPDDTRPSPDSADEAPADVAGSAGGGLQRHADLWQCNRKGVCHVFVEHPLFSSSDIYGETAGGGKGSYGEADSQPDLDLRYSVLCQAALAAPVLLERQAAAAALEQGTEAAPAAQAELQTIVFVANDWPTALLLLRMQYIIRAAAPPDGGAAASESDGGTADSDSLSRLLVQRLRTNAATCFCIHNLAYHGLLDPQGFERLSLPAAALPALCTSHDWRRVLLNRNSGSRPDPAAGAQTGAASVVATPAASATISSGKRRRCPDPAPEPATTSSDTNARAAGADAAGAAATSSDTSAEAVAADADEAAAACAGGQLNQMRAALLAADCLVTVSGGYAAEVQQEGAFGCGLHDVLAARGVSGIMNGLDTAEWDPATDQHLPESGRYSAATVAEGKAHMKACLQQRLGLRVDPHVPLMGFVGRLTEQKGVDVLLAAAPALLGGCSSNVPAPSRWRPQPLPKTAEKVAAAAAGVAGKAPLLGAAILQAGAAVAGGSVRNSSFGTASDAAPSAAGVSNLPLSTCGAVPPEQGRSAGEAGMQIVVLGTGEAWMETGLLGLAQSFPRQAAGITSFSEELAHWILAAADFCLVPSRFEPCGLVAQAGIQYGCVPIVTRVGGLKDLVTPEVGYSFPGFSQGPAADHQQNVQQLVEGVQRAAAEYGSARYLAMQQTGMALDVSWERPAKQWESLVAAVSLQHTSTTPP